MVKFAEHRFCRDKAATAKKCFSTERAGVNRPGLVCDRGAGLVREPALGGALAQSKEREIDSMNAVEPGAGYNFAAIEVYSSVLGKIRPKLTVNIPGDIHEQEADAVAEQVLRLPSVLAADFRQQAGALDRIQRKAADEAQWQAVPPIVSEVLKSSGQPLEASARAFMEPRFGHDFSLVRVHTGNEASRSAQAVGALAYTAGRHIVFGPGYYNLATADGLRLLAHELTHTLQSPDPGKAHGVLRRDKEKEGQKKKPEEPTKKAPKCQMAQAQIRPVFFSNDPGKSDPSPTGKSLDPRLKEANRIWGKCGIEFTAEKPRMVEDSVSKVAGKNGGELDKVQDAYSKKGTGPQVFFLDNDLSAFGGGRTGPNFGDKMATGDDAKIMLSDHGSNDRLLAHELGHAMGLLHPDVMPFIPNNSIMQPTGIGATNPDLVTDRMCRLLAWPAKTDEKCWHVDPDEKATFEKPSR
jgi:hypothetical protein